MDKPKILFIDDEESVLSSMRRELRKEPYLVITKSNGQDGLDILKKEEIAVIVCDQMMPVMNGAEVLRQARIISPDTIRITLTAYTDPDSFVKTVNEGQISQLILKPWDSETLKHVLRQSVKNYYLTEKNTALELELRSKNEQLVTLNKSLEARVQERTEKLMQSRKSLATGFREVITMLSDLIELQLEELRGHGRRVSEISRRMAVALGLADDVVWKIETAAFLHDLGMIFLPEEITRRGGHTKNSEVNELYKLHVSRGAELLKQITAFNDISQIVEQHHEAFDGTGFPCGFSGPNIHIGARIIAVADKYDELLHPYGDVALTTDQQAADMLLREAGHLLDPDLVNLFMKEIHHDIINLASDIVELPFRCLKAGMVLAKDVDSVSGAILVRSQTELTCLILDRLKHNKNCDPHVSRFYVTRESILGVGGYELEEETDNDDLGEELPTIMIVDDELSVINALKRELRSVYKVLGYTNPHEALRRLKEGGVSLLISDFNMPIIKGDEMIRLARNCQKTLPCVILTGYATRRNVERLVATGSLTRIFSKPWDKNELMNTLDNIIQENRHNV